ncbi:hypothetical protein DL89DRAFT_269584 [Linderina pennispora]|uniref:Uncharacterized protein n=1 Tax=Linderina pennispora TaxID=61395 RepID=A0A1Y1W0X7_9FUNG|nr:uncharacterized protein DL89DRAFT_269584 [Linderina pennispora]ORX67157.1 hypothetical protein DL89DRAFT_269584 [Linderina pennispora]
MTCTARGMEDTQAYVVVRLQGSPMAHLIINAVWILSLGQTFQADLGNSSVV